MPTNQVSTKTRKPRKPGPRQLERARAAFVKAAREAVEALGAVALPAMFPGDIDTAYTLQTRAGALRITPYAATHDRYLGGWIAARFEDAERASALLNPSGVRFFDVPSVSGKWNVDSLYEATDVDEIKREITRHFRKAL